ncbi:MAG: PAS domain S-box protein, partial [Cyanobacteria bacterium P01_A01_bin.83]
DLKREMKQHLASKEALAKSEQKFRTIFEHAGVGIVVTGLDKKLLQVNPQFCQFLGYSAAELETMTFEQFTHRDHRQDDYQQVKQMLSNNLSTLVKEKRYIHKNGSIVWGNLTAVAVKDSQQKPSYFIAVVEDITKRKQAELALLESEVQFVSLLNSCPFLVWTAGTDGMCNFFNTAWLTFTGRALQQELGDGWCQGVHPEDLEFCLDTYQTAFARRERFKMEYRLRQRNGKYGWIYDEGIPRFKADGSFAGYIGTCVDISDRIKAKQEREQLLQRVEQERKFLEIVLQQMPAGVVIVEAPSRKIILSNPQAAEIMRQIKIADLTKIEDCTQVKFWNRKGKPKTINELPIIKALAGEITSGEELEVLCEDDSKRIIFANAAPIRNAKSDIVAAVATFYDITEQKQAQAAKKEAETKSILLKEIHHRIKNNLQVVSSLLDLQTEQIEDEAVQVLLEKSQTRIYTMALIHEKLYSTKNLDRINFDEYVTSLCSYLFDSFVQDSKQIKLQLELEPTELSIDLATPCGLIINELVANALEHGFVNQATGEIKIEFKKSAQNCYLSIQDNGCGFNFDADEISKNTHFLGLSLVISLVEKQLKGNWKVEPSQGFVIKITFPYI